jgi:hypothetical protein
VGGPAHFSLAGMIFGCDDAVRLPLESNRHPDASTMSSSPSGGQLAALGGALCGVGTGSVRRERLKTGWDGNLTGRGGR